MDDTRFPIWGGPALGLFIGLIVGFGTGDVAKGAIVGVLAGGVAGFASWLFGSGDDHQMSN